MVEDCLPLTLGRLNLWYGTLLWVRTKNKNKKNKTKHEIRKWPQSFREYTGEDSIYLVPSCQSSRSYPGSLLSSVLSLHYCKSSRILPLNILSSGWNWWLRWAFARSRREAEYRTCSHTAWAFFAAEIVLRLSRLSSHSRRAVQREGCLAHNS